MQSILFWKQNDNDPVSAIINLDLLAGARPSDKPDVTELLIAGSIIELPVSFSLFVEKVQELVAENYRYSNEISAAWHNKRMEDTKRIMEETMKGIHQ